MARDTKECSHDRLRSHSAGFMISCVACEATWTCRSHNQPGGGCGDVCYGAGFREWYADDGSRKTGLTERQEEVFCRVPSRPKYGHEPQWRLFQGPDLRVARNLEEMGLVEWVAYDRQYPGAYFTLTPYGEQVMFLLPMAGR